MYFKEFTLRADYPEDILTEILYEIASARADGAELLRINIPSGDSFSLPLKRRHSVLTRIFKNMKNSKRIQFFATNESFAGQNTEAVFLQNKYPEHFLNAGVDEETTFIYIKL